VLERVSIGELAPDLTVILDLPVQVGLERAKLRRGNVVADRFEGEGADFHEKLREAYLGIAAREPDRCVIIDANAAKEAVASAIWQVVQSRLQPPALRRVDEPAAAKV
jgi:dTMP kinase